MRSPFVWTLRFTARVCRKLGAVGVRGALLADITRGYPAASWRMADQRPMVPAPLYGHVGTGRDSGNDSSDCGSEVCARHWYSRAERGTRRSGAYRLVFSVPALVIRYVSRVC